MTEIGHGPAPGQRALGKMVVGNVPFVAAGRFRDREAIHCVGTGRRLSYRQINERCNRLARALGGLGLQKPQVVAFLCNNRAELVEIYFALAKSGLVGIPLNYRLAPAEIIALMKAMDARALIFETRFAAAAEQVRTALPDVEHFIAIGEGRPAGALDYEALLAEASTAEPEVEIEEHDPYYLNLTSGTTGLPKSYVLTHFNNSGIGSMFSGFDTTSHDVLMTVFPAFGRVGFAWLIAGFIYGARNVLMDFHPGQAMEMIEREGVTMVNFVPTMAAMMLADPSRAGRDLKSLRALVFAGSMFPAPLRERVEAELCPRIYEYYGMQETGMVTLSTPEDRRLAPESVGVTSLFAEVHILRLDGSEAPRGEIGEVAARSPGAVTAYFENPAKSAETFRGGFVHTGDLGMMNADGFLFLKGRLKDMIITGGQNVYAAEVEEVLSTLAGVGDCAVFGLADEIWGERVSALIVRAQGAVASEEEIKAACREKLAGFKTPKSIFFQNDPLPRTPTGKVQKFLLVERYGGKG